jgi:hypothetical protein
MLCVFDMTGIPADCIIRLVECQYAVFSGCVVGLLQYSLWLLDNGTTGCMHMCCGAGL